LTHSKLTLPKGSLRLGRIPMNMIRRAYLLRKAAARTVGAVLAAIGELLGAYTARECANYFANAGYERI
jgi:putative transposase